LEVPRNSPVEFCTGTSFRTRTDCLFRSPVLGKYFQRHRTFFKIFHSQTTTNKRDHLKFLKKTREASESGFSFSLLASKIRPVSLNIRSLVIDDAEIESITGAKRDNCGYIPRGKKRIGIK
jgi:hypothetical protein